MKRFFALILSAGLISTASVVGLATPASADTPGCVSAREYGAVYRGMTQTRVHAIFDTSGTLLNRWSTPGYWDYQTDWDAYDAAYAEWEAAEPYWDDYGWEWDQWWASMPEVGEYEYETWVPGRTDTVRSYRKCRGFDGGRGRVGINFDNYTSAAGGLRVFQKVRSNPWTLAVYN